MSTLPASSTSPPEQLILDYLSRLRACLGEIETIPAMKEEQKNACMNRINELDRERGRFKFLQALKTDAGTEAQVGKEEEKFTDEELAILETEEEALNK